MTDFLESKKFLEQLDPGIHVPGTRVLFYKFSKQNVYEVIILGYNKTSEWIKMEIVCSFPPGGPPSGTHVWMDNRSISVIEVLQ
jgi:hypothetical protein